MGLMESFSNLLAPYSHQIGSVAGFVTTLQFLSGFVFLNNIRKKGSSDVFPPHPFLGGTVLTILTLKLGYILDNGPMVNVNLLGVVINIFSLGVFYYYASSQRRTQIWNYVGIAAAFTIAVIAYTNFEDPAKVEFRLSMLITGILVFLVGSPLLNLGDIIRKQSTEGLPFPIILTGSLVATLWGLHAISIRNYSMAYQNFFLCVLSYIQLSLFVIYPNTPTKTGEKLKRNNGSPNGSPKSKNSNSPKKLANKKAD